MLWWWRRKLKSENSRERARAIEKIAAYKSPAAVQLLAQVMLDSRQGAETRAEAARWLGQIGDRRAVPALIEALCSPFVRLSDNAEAALRQIDPDWLHSAEAKDASPTLLLGLVKGYQENLASDGKRCQERMALPSEVPC